MASPGMWTQDQGVCPSAGETRRRPLELIRADIALLGRDVKRILIPRVTAMRCLALELAQHMPDEDVTDLMTAGQICPAAEWECQGLLHHGADTMAELTDSLDVAAISTPLRAAVHWSSLKADLAESPAEALEAIHGLLGAMRRHAAGPPPSQTVGRVLSVCSDSVSAYLPALRPHHLVSMPVHVFEDFERRPHHPELAELYAALGDGDDDTEAPVRRLEPGARFLVRVEPVGEVMNLSHVTAGPPVGWLTVFSFLQEALFAEQERPKITVFVRALWPDRGSVFVLAPSLDPYPFRVPSPNGVEAGSLYAVEARRQRRGGDVERPAAAWVLEPQSWRPIEEPNVRKSLRTLWSWLIDSAKQLEGIGVHDD